MDWFSFFSYSVIYSALHLSGCIDSKQFFSCAYLSLLFIPIAYALIVVATFDKELTERRKVIKSILYTLLTTSLQVENFIFIAHMELHFHWMGKLPRLTLPGVG